MRILFYRENYLNSTETFIYQYLKNSGKIKELKIDFLANNNLKNKNFPYNNVKFLPLGFTYKLFLKFRQYYLSNFFRRKLLCNYNAKNYDAIHAHFGYEGWYILPLAVKYRLPLFCTFYGHDLSHIPREKKIWFKRYRELFDYGVAFFVEGKFMKSSLIELGCPEEKIVILPISISIDEVSFKPKQIDLNKKTIEILMVGRFVEKKGFEYGLRAIHRLINDHNMNIMLHLIGGGILEEKIKNLVSELDLENIVIFHGFLSYEKYLEILGKIDLCIVPSVTAINGDSEGGAPTILLEMQAKGVPIIASQHADIPNVLPENYPFLAYERNDYDLAEKISNYLDTENKDILLKNSRLFVEKNHDVLKNIEKLFNTYKKFIKE